MEYELMYLIADTKKEELPKIKEEINAIITKAGAKLTNDSFEFSQKLAYEIKHCWHGTYVVQRFTLGNKDEREKSITYDELTEDVIKEITRQLNLHKDLLRYIIVNAKDLPSLAEFKTSIEQNSKENKKTLKEKGEKIDGKLEKVLKI